MVNPDEKAKNPNKSENENEMLITGKKDDSDDNAEEDSIDITVPKLKIERIKMKFGGVRIAIHDADKE